MNRNIGDVIDQILAVVPADADELRERLNWHKRDAGFKAPEQMGQCWSNLAVSLYELIGTPTADWHRQVQTIFNGGQQ